MTTGSRCKLDLHVRQCLVLGLCDQLSIPLLFKARLLLWKYRCCCRRNPELLLLVRCTQATQQHLSLSCSGILLSAMCYCRGLSNGLCGHLNGVYPHRS